MFLLVLLFILVPIAELYVIIQVGGAIGVGPTIAILILDGLLGAFLLRQQGRAAWVRFNRALAENRLPHKEVLDGVLIIFGGALLLTPGFLTDIVGLILLIPPTRAGVRALMARIVRGRLSMAGGDLGLRAGPAARSAPEAGAGRPFPRRTWWTRCTRRASAEWPPRTRPRRLGGGTLPGTDSPRRPPTR